MNRLRFARRDDGFTLIEAVVALVIIFGLMLVLLRTFDSSSRVLVETRRQATASRLASQLIERAQALEWDHMGLATSNNGADCVTEQIGCYVNNPFTGLAADGFGGYLFEGEQIVFSNADTFAPFIDVHSTEPRDGTNFERYLFVTSIVNPISGEETARRIMAFVEWIPPNGFRRQVRLDTIVSEYREPSQPLISGEVEYDAGNFALRHRDGVSNGSALDGSRWWNLEVDPSGAPPYPTINLYPFGPARTSAVGIVLFPNLQLEAVSDFVSGTALQYQGTNVGDLAWAGVKASVPDPHSAFLFSDDDPSTIQPLNQGLIFNQAVQGYHYTAAPTRDLVVAETESGTDLSEIAIDQLDTTGVNNTVFNAELWTQLLNGLPTEDELPYVKFETAANGTADGIQIGFVEYDWESGDDPLATSENRFMYEQTSADLEDVEYEFNLYRRGKDTSVFDLTASIDRNNATTGERTITGSIQVTPDVIYLLDDDAYSGTSKGKNAQFAGFVKVTIPTITVAAVTSGQAVLPAPTLTAASDLIIHQWDPTSGPAGAYVEAARVDYNTLGKDCSLTDQAVPTVTVPLFGGAVLFDQIRKINNPWLDYEVSGTITIRGWCKTVTTDAVGNVNRSEISTHGPVVTGELKYKVTDVYWRDGTLIDKDTGATLLVGASWGPYAPGEMVLFDIDMHFDADAVSVSTVYVDPNAG